MCRETNLGRGMPVLVLIFGGQGNRLLRYDASNRVAVLQPVGYRSGEKCLLNKPSVPRRFALRPNC